MLTPAWYLINGDYFADLSQVPQLNSASSAISTVAHTLGDDAMYSPALTVAATYLALLATEHLNDEVTDTPAVTPWPNWPGCCTA